MVELRNSSAWDCIRYVASFVLLIFSTIVTTYAIFDGDTGFWKEVPGPVAFLLLVVCLVLLGIVEGLQIALVELKRQHPDAYKHSHKRAYQLGQVANMKDNVERFLMGRQVLVVFLVFFIAKLTTIHLRNLESDFLFPVPQWLYASVLETGFITCILVVIVAQLMPQIIAAKYPVHFLDIRVMYFFYHLCTFIEATGLTHACWVLSHLIGKAAGMTKEDCLFVKSKLGITAGEKQSCLQSTQVSAETNLKDVEKALDDNKTVKDKEHPDISIMEKMHVLVKTLDSELTEEKQAIIRYYLDRHPERFQTFPSVIGNKVYAPPHQLAERFRSIGVEPPAFLLDISNPCHVPPHVVACELLLLTSELQQRIEQLEDDIEKCKATETAS